MCLDTARSGEHGHGSAMTVRRESRARAITGVMTAANPRKHASTRLVFDPSEICT
jgi:hypothetical protein